MPKFNMRTAWNDKKREDDRLARLHNKKKPEETSQPAAEGEAKDMKAETAEEQKTDK